MKNPAKKESKARRRANPATHIAIALVLVVTSMATSAFLAKWGILPWTTLIFVAGTVGGVVNSFRRIQSLTLTKARQAGVMAEKLIVIQIYLSPFVGGIFAMVLYVIFMSGFVQGVLFPAFAAVESPFTTFESFAALAMPATNNDMAKALLWAFVAGFTEGLVPNFITKITKEALPEVPTEETSPEVPEPQEPEAVEKPKTSG